MGAFAPPKQMDVAATATPLKHRLDSDDYDERVWAVRELELRIITHNGQCPDDIVNNLRVRIFQLDPVSMQQYLDRPYDHNFQDGVGYLVDASFSL